MTIELPETARAMLDPGIYSDKPVKVEMVQTQMSFVFLTGRYVYKVKKPVNLGYLDYSTLDKRKYFCEQEIKLNKRLCDDTYLGVVSIRKDQNGYNLDGPGETVEYAVKMLTLPQSRMLNVLLDRNQVSSEMIGQLAGKLAEFHAQAENNPRINSFGEIQAIRVNTEENFSQTEKYVGTLISASQHRNIKAYCDAVLAKKSSLFIRRLSEGRIRDCHGDLHSRNICFNKGICIYDCIEFNDRFRYCDVASEIAFLAMDLDHYGRADLSHQFIREYIRLSNDDGIEGLLKFYKSYRAFVRGKVMCFKSESPSINELERNQTMESARSYFGLAEAYTRSQPTLFITVGLVGSGKSTTSRAVARRLGLTVISSDIVRKQMAAIPAGEHRLDRMDSGIYSADFTQRVYDKLYAEAKALLMQGDSVLLDASFIKSQDRLAAKNIADVTQSDFFIIECILDEDNTRKRLFDRFKGNSVSDGRWEIYEPQKKKFEPVSEVMDDHHFIVDGAKPLYEQINAIVSNI
jgi:aminoglycoside phosphotransferase family enzyme/predicted kinase